MDLRGQGTLLDPLLSGVLETDGASIGIQKPRLLAENLNLRIELDNNRLEIRKLEGLLNGGRIRGSGGAAFRGKQAGVVSVELSGQDIFLEYPRGVRSSSNLNLQVRNVGQEIVIGGDVEIREGSYVEPFDFMSAAELTGEVVSQNKTQAPGSKFRYDIKIKTLQPFEINNNLARLSARADMRLVGYAASSGPARHHDPRSRWEDLVWGPGLLHGAGSCDFCQ